MVWHVATPTTAPTAPFISALASGVKASNIHGLGVLGVLTFAKTKARAKTSETTDEATSLPSDNVAMLYDRLGAYCSTVLSVEIAHTHTLVYICTCVGVRMSMCILTICIFVCMYLCMYACMYVCMYACMHCKTL